MPNRIDKLIVKAFRGASSATELSFDPNLPASMLFGENGTGKSSIVDAIDFVCNGKFGSLDSCKLGRGKRKHEFIPSLGRQASDVHVEITSGSSKWTATLSGPNATTCDTPNRPRAWILRRTELLSFVEADPSERYRKLASYIAVQHIEDSESTLSKTLSALERETTEATQATKQAMAALRSYWEAEGRPGETAYAWAIAEVEKEGSELSANVGKCKAITEACANLASCLSKRQTAEQDATAASRALSDADGALREAMTGHAIGTKELLRTLKDARSLLVVAPETDACPVCERPIEFAPLATRLTSRIDQLETLDRLVQARDIAAVAQSQSNALWKHAEIAIIEASRKLAALASASTIPEIDALTISWSDFSALLENDIPLDDASVASESATFAKHADAVQEAAMIRLESDQKTLNQLNGIKQQVQTLLQKAKQLKAMEKLHERVENALQIYKNTRQRYIDQLLQGISTEVDRMYAILHPGEALGGLKLYLDPNQRGSLKFDARFESESVTPPQAFYSESHLDTLGVCIFLALAKRFASANSVVVLDDVFTSVDQVHLERLIGLLNDEATQFNQTIITTHYRPWRDAYRFQRGARMQLIELLPWTLQRGIRHTKTRLVVDELRAFVAREPLDRQGVASKAGIILEGLLDHLTLLYECPVSRRAEGRYTLGDLLGAIGSKLKKVLAVVRPSPNGDSQEAEVPLGPPIDELGSTAWIRNEVGCHFNVAGNASDVDVTRFAERVIAFADTLICAECGELPRNSRNGTDRNCRCGKTRLRPLEAP